MSTVMTIKVDGKEAQRNRKGKVGGWMPEVARGNGVHTPTSFKKKTKQKAKNELRKYIG